MYSELLQLEARKIYMLSTRDFKKKCCESVDQSLFSWYSKYRCQRDNASAKQDVE